MATKKRKAPARRRTTRRRSTRSAGFNLDPMNIGLAIGGGLLAHAYLDKLPIEDQRVRYGIGAIAPFALMNMMPQGLKPLAAGFGLAAGAKAAMAIFPQVALLAGGSPAGTTIGRLTASEERKVRQQVLNAAKINGSDAVIVGAQDAVIVGGYGMKRGPWT